MPTSSFADTMDCPVVAVERRVDFADTDAAGLLHFSRYFAYAEAAAGTWLEQLGIPLFVEAEGAVVGFPRVHVDAHYEAPVFYGDTLRLETQLCARGERSFTLQTLFRRASEAPLARVQQRLVHARRAIGSAELSVLSLPQALLELAIHPAQSPRRAAAEAAE